MTQHQADGVSEAMLEAGVAAFGNTETLSVRRLLEVAYPAMRALDPVLAALKPFLPITVRETPDYAELQFGEHETQAMTLRPDDWLALNDAAQPQAHPINDEETTNGR